MRLTSNTRRTVALALAAAQLFAVAHLALVPHTTNAAGQVAGSRFDIIEHLDASAHPGPHAHNAAPVAATQGEENCAVVGLLRASLSQRAPAPAPLCRAVFDSPSTAPDVFAEPTRRQRLLAAPKASPPFADVA